MQFKTNNKTVLHIKNEVLLTTIKRNRQTYTCDNHLTPISGMLLVILTDIAINERHTLGQIKY